ncbi:glycoside hydrolase family 24 protein [Burkholderia alba]|uniref:glycoside hydrolase family 24 protein n=1 Tax=Burkholderia alba TaxID=2683677 RepID=UPI002B05794F|nr:glycoside hydrolase family 104 protein [Burkholderia alba]
MPRIAADVAGGQNVCAFLDMIARSEIDAYTLAHSDDGYNVLVGSHGPMVRNGQSIPAKVMTFPSYAAHPNIYNASLNSTAAGRYQALNRFAVAYMASLRLPDFGPVSQDRIAIQQIRERRAIPLILAGQFAAAVTACSNIWASLPGNSYGQHQNLVTTLQSYFVAAGGCVASA